MPVAGSTTAALVFLTTFRTGELRALISDNSATLWSYSREAMICTLLPLLTALLVVFSMGLAIDAVHALRGRHGFSAPDAAFVLFVGLLIMVVMYQLFLAGTAWKQWNTKRAAG
jgi:hypothetical protein